MNQRIFVKKKEAFQVESASLFHELANNLNLRGLQSVELYNSYDVYHADENDINLLKTNVLSEIVTDEVCDEIDLSDKQFVAYECLPGQYDQRSDSAQQTGRSNQKRTNRYFKRDTQHRGTKRCEKILDQSGGNA